MKGMSRYYLSRALVSAAVVVLLMLGGTPWWGAMLSGVIVFGLFVWAVRSGRYVVHPELGVTALRDDEYTRAIRDRAARYAFVAVTLILGGVGFYFGRIAHADVPVPVVSGVLFLGGIVYFASDFWSRRS